MYLLIFFKELYYMLHAKGPCYIIHNAGPSNVRKVIRFLNFRALNLTLSWYIFATNKYNLNTIFRLINETG